MTNIEAAKVIVEMFYCWRAHNPKEYANSAQEATALAVAALLNDNIEINQT